MINLVVWLLSRFPYLVRFISRIFGAVILVPALSFGQSSGVLTKKDQKILETARIQLNAKNYPASLKSLNKLDNRLPEVMLVYGLLADEQNNKTEAIGWFLKVLDQAPRLEPKLLHYLGGYYFDQRQYAQAKQYFELYLTSGSSTPGLLKSSKAYLEKIKSLETWMSKAVDIAIQPIPGIINTPRPEYLPVITADSRMLFIRRVNNQEDLYLSINQLGVWQEPQPLVEINTLENEGAASVSADGRWLVFTGCERPEGLGGCDLYIAEKTNFGWSSPRLLGLGVNTSGWEAQPALNRDGTALIFSSNRAGGHGGRDLWYSRKNGQHWTPAVNLGPIINTPGDEETPFLHADGQSIYFASTGHPGLGQADLFFTYWSEQDNNWTKPQNLGYPINTPAKEGGLVVDINGSTAYFTRDTIKDNQPDLDIYTFQLPRTLQAQPMTYLRLQVLDALTGRPLPHFLQVLHLDDLDTLIQTQIQQTPILIIKPSQKYLISIQAEGYLPYSDHISYDQVHFLTHPYDTIIRLYPLPVKKESDPIVLKNIFFMTGSSELIASSFSELEILKNYLISHPDFKIEIRGHTDDTGNELLNYQLSIDRAKVVHDYLIQQGVPARRLRYAGFGSQRPVAENKTTAGRTQNRRTEFVILSE